MSARLHGLLLLAPSALCAALAAPALWVSWRDRGELLARWGAAWWLAPLGLAVSAGAALALIALRGRALIAGSSRPRGFASLRLAFVALVAAWLAYIAFLQPYLTYTVGLTLTLALGLHSIGALFVMWRGAPRGRAWRWLEFALFQLCLAALLLELALSALGAAGLSPLLDHGGLSARAMIERHRDPPGFVRLGFACNSRGDYDAEPSLPPRSTPLAVCIGDSFSTGIVPHALHFTTVAEQALAAELGPVEVYNMGISAIGPAEYELLLDEQALPLAPDLVVVDVFAGNDVLQEQIQEGFAGAARRWFVRDRLQVVLVAQRLAALRREARENLLEPGADRVGELPGERALRDQGPMSFERVCALIPWFEDPMRERASYSAEFFESLKLSRARAICRPTASFEGLYRRLEAMHKAARAADTPLAVMLIPDEFQVEEALWEHLLELAPGESWQRFRLQEELVAWCAARGIACLDLAPALGRVPLLADGRRHVYHLRDTHLNARGNRVAGEELARFLAAQLGR